MFSINQWSIGLVLLALSSIAWCFGYFFTFQLPNCHRVTTYRNLAYWTSILSGAGGTVLLYRESLQPFVVDITAEVPSAIDISLSIGLWAGFVVWFHIAYGDSIGMEALEDVYLFSWLPKPPYAGPAREEFLRRWSTDPVVVGDQEKDAKAGIKVEPVLGDHQAH